MKPLSTLPFALLFAVLLALGSSQPLLAQDDTDLTEYIDFFEDKESEFKAWLKTSRLAAAVILTGVDVNEEVVKVGLKAHAWDALETKVRAEQNQDLTELLFSRVLFTFDLRPHQASMTIDIGGTSILADHEGESLTIKREKNQGSMPGSVVVDISELSFYNASAHNAKGSTAEVRSKLTAALKTYFSQYEAKFENYGFDSYRVGTNGFAIEVKNVRNVVLDKDYFEFLLLQFSFSEANGELQVTYNLDCKYGSGIIWAPRSSGYYDMFSKYRDQMERFNIKLSGKISDILTQG